MEYLLLAFCTFHLSIGIKEVEYLSGSNANRGEVASRTEASC